MARSQIAVTEIDRVGVAAGAQTTADSANDHYFTGNDGRVLLEIVSTDAGAQTVEIEPNPALTVDGLTITNLSIAVPAGATRYVGPFRGNTFNQNSSGDVYVNPSVSTTLKFRCYQLPTP
jgi:hypothetical protein